MLKNIILVVFDYLLAVPTRRDAVCAAVNPLERRGNYSATVNNMKLVHLPSMGGLLHLVQRGGD